MLNRTYLKSEELNYIINTCLKSEDFISREFLKIGLCAQFVMDDIEISGFETCNDIYNYLVERGIDLNKEIVNIDVVDKTLDKYDSFDYKIDNLLKGMEKISELSELSNEIKKLDEESKPKKKNSRKTTQIDQEDTSK